MKLPVIDGGGDLDTFDDLDRQISRSVSPISTNIRIPKSAIAGIVGDQLSTMEISKCHFSLIKPVTSCIINILLAIQYNTTPYNIIQCKTINTIQYNTIQYNILPCFACLVVVTFVVIVYANLLDVKTSFLKEILLVVNAESPIWNLPP